jgi:hypothetical protein
MKETKRGRNALLDLAIEERQRVERGEPPPPPQRRPLSFIERTNQRWKLWVSDILNLVGLSIYFGACWFRSDPSVGGILAGTVVAGISFVWSCLAIRCPRCRTRVIWHSYSHRSAGDAQVRARYQVVCPACGFDPAPENERATPEAEGGS